MWTIAFVCTGNAGRSQLATGLAEREREHRGIDVELVTGGIDPGEAVYPTVRTALEELDVDIGDRQPRAIEPADLERVDLVVTMGCSIADRLPPGFDGEVREWDIDADGDALPAVRRQREALSAKVTELFDDLEGLA